MFPGVLFSYGGTAIMRLEEFPCGDGRLFFEQKMTNLFWGVSWWCVSRIPIKGVQDMVTNQCFISLKVSSTYVFFRPRVPIGVARDMKI